MDRLSENVPEYQPADAADERQNGSFEKTLSQ
jgi:hypothetical protein